ncbi:MAG TPA: hypothetical protein VND94_00715 [Terriglobia bacterium]|nr:hypothetical protein [Terriglobia bacterium]
MGVKTGDVIRCASHLAWLRTRQCAVARAAGHVCEGKIEAAHVRSGTDGGIGIKPSDIYALPLCAGGHREQHCIGEAAFERRYGIDLKQIAAEHAKASPHRRKWEQLHD